MVNSGESGWWWLEHEFYVPVSWEYMIYSQLTNSYFSEGYVYHQPDNKLGRNNKRLDFSEFTIQNFQCSQISPKMEDVLDCEVLYGMLHLMRQRKMPRDRFSISPSLGRIAGDHMDTVVICYCEWFFLPFSFFRCIFVEKMINEWKRHKSLLFGYYSHGHPTNAATPCRSMPVSWIQVFFPEKLRSVSDLPWAWGVVLWKNW